MSEYDGSDFQIIYDKEKDGIRRIEVYPSSMVCSQFIEIEIKGDVIQSVVYSGGCDGNTKGVGALIRGMKVDEAIRRLDGITCGGKPTSCPDQLARILKSL